jgi:hypothetical protein
MTRSKHTELTEHGATEGTGSRAAKRRGDVEDDWRHLERHLLSQSTTSVVQTITAARYA